MKIRSTSSRFLQLHRRGSAYVLVMGVALLLTVIGMGTLLTTRIAGRQSTNATDWQQAGILARSMVEHAISYINAKCATSPNSCGAPFTSYTTGASYAFTQTTSVGTGGWVVKDEYDGNFTDNYYDPFRIYGIAKVGQTTRVYSVQVVPAGLPQDVLRCGFHSGGNVITTGTITLGAGPMSTNARIQTNATIYGNVEAVNQNGPSNRVSGTLTAPAPAKPMPSGGLYNVYLSKATALPWASVNSAISNQLLSSTHNTFGPTNPEGIYSITVPTNGNLTISSSQISGTLVISMINGTFTLSGPVVWKPQRPDYPMLIFNGTNCALILHGSTTWLSESTIGLDLNGNGTTTDDIPPQYQGLMHIIGSSNSVQLNTNAYFKGLFITDGNVTATGETSYISDPYLYSNPPMGYGTGTQMAIVPGSWIWDSPP